MFAIAFHSLTTNASNLRNSWPAKLIAHVLMPDHFHLISNPRDGDIQGFTGALKGKLSLQIIEVTGDLFLLPKPGADGSIHQVWQESFKAVPLWSAWMIWQKINYIHANPVKAKLVTSAKDYKWSSFRAFYSSSEEPLTIDQDWWWPDDSMKLSKAMKELGWRTYHKRSSE
jgi:REP element-mobilizing transposase RayT